MPTAGPVLPIVPWSLATPPVEEGNIGVVLVLKRGAYAIASAFGGVKATGHVGWPTPMFSLAERRLGPGSD